MLLASIYYAGANQVILLVYSQRGAMNVRVKMTLNVSWEGEAQLLEAINLKKEYGAHEVLKGLNFRVESASISKKITTRFLIVSGCRKMPTAAGSRHTQRACTKKLVLPSHWPSRQTVYYWTNRLLASIPKLVMNSQNY